MLKTKQSPAIRVAVMGVMTALVTAATMLFQLSIPTTMGYFNLGESMVYITALTFGPYIGGFAGGVGSMMADLLTGYVIFAPATLISKGIEGTIVGYLSINLQKVIGKYASNTATLVGLINASILATIGAFFFVGFAEIVGVLSGDTTLYSFSIFLSPLVWIVIGGICFITIYTMGKKYPNTTHNLIAMIIGGAMMILGYFVFEQFFLGVAAIAEVPFNTAQVLIGIIIALPISKTLKTKLPYLTDNKEGED
ncbi:MAG: ECF transporter S component [Candidatus Ranarchaeia archaeon]